jgi:predicted O-linked N-acetylglucosamine transferase (SPINDLY family)
VADPTEALAAGLGTIGTLEGALDAIAALHRAGRLAEARAACREAAARHPADPEPHFREGLLEAELGSLAAAREAIGRALAMREMAHYRYALGDVLERLGDRAAAIEAWRRAIALQPALVPAHVRLGVALQESGELAQATAHFVLAVEHRPTDGRAWNNLAAALMAQDRPAEAEIAARKALEIDPLRASAAHNLGRALLAQGRREEAAPWLESAVSRDPRNGHAWDLLGMCRLGERALLAAREAFLRSVASDPSHAGPWLRLGKVCTHLGLVEEAIQAFGKAEALSPPEAAEVGSTLLFTLQYHGTLGTRAIFDAHRAWAARHAPEAGAKPAFSNSREPERRLRIGYVSPRFHQSSAAFLFVPVAEHHDRERFEIHCYAQQDLEDDVTARIRACSASWTDTRPLDDRELAARLRDDGIDIAIDLAGHTPGHRLPMFAHGPAPVTGTWLDYFNTTGMDGIDFLLTDAVSSPPGDAQPFTERLVRLPACRYCWEPPAYAPAVEPPPLARGAQSPVFGSFNRMAKISPATLEGWCALLQRIPSARLLVKNSALDNAAEHAFFSGWFRDRGVDPARIEWQGESAHREMLAEYAAIDVVLDTFPYNGGVTTLEALWMGRPVVAVGGDTLISRQSKAILAAIGMPELCATDPRAFVETAADLVQDPVRLARLSASLRDRLRASALLDHAGFTRGLESALRAEWRRWCLAAG